MNRAWLAPVALIYGMVISVRHKMYDWGWLRVRRFDIPVLSVGNLTVGGTGKTPVVEMLVRRLKDTHNIAVISLGYKRRTKGYLEVEQGMSFLKTGDEPKQIKMKFPDVVVAVCKRRADGIDLIRKHHPEVNLIIMDDGFQHRRVEPWVNIVLMDCTRPIYHDHLLPWGMLRDSVSQLPRAHYVLVTKCPGDMSPIDRRIVRKSLKLYPYQGLYFCHNVAGQPTAIFSEALYKPPKPGAQVVAMSGIGNPAAFERGLEGRYDVVDRLRYPDHHPYRSHDLRDMRRVLEQTPDAVIMTTEKDSVKLTNSRKIPSEIRERLFYQPIRVAFADDDEFDFISKLKNDLRTDPRDRFFHTK